MPAPRPWTVLPHKPWEKLSENVWTVSAALHRGGLQRRMTVLKRADGRLVVHSAACLDDASMRALEAWGEPAFIVVPNGFHRLDAHAWKARYAAAKVLCPKDVAAAVAKVVAVDGHYEDLPSDAGVSVSPLAGIHPRLGEGVFSARDAAGLGVLVFCDALFNHAHMSGFQGWVVKTMGSTGGPRVTPLMRMVGVRDRAALAGHLRQLAESPGLAALVPGHGDVVAQAASDTLGTVANDLHSA